MTNEEALDGWGFRDTRFELNEHGNVVLSGNRYALSQKELPELLPWFGSKLGVELSRNTEIVSHYPPTIQSTAAHADDLRELTAIVGSENVLVDDAARLRHSHGHTASEIWSIRYGSWDRVPDVVVSPTEHAQVTQLITWAKGRPATLIPFGGGTNVTHALVIPQNERRLVLSVDMRKMNRCLAVSVVDRTAHFEAGITGRALEAELEKHGLTLGHEPDSLEFSTLGGWIATNASGMKKNRYGNIEDLVLDATVASAHGTLERPPVGPRESVGVRPLQYMIGSEGNFGIITSAVVKVRPVPTFRSYGSVVFPSLETGFAFLYELANSGAIPASVRLMDNTQFQFGQALKPAPKGRWARARRSLERHFVTKIKGFDPTRLTAATLVFEGSKEEVAFQRTVVHRLSKRHGGLSGGSNNGELGYQLTFGIAYIRDLAFSLGAIAESFETSVPWSQALGLYHRVQKRIEDEHRALDLPGKPFFTGRFTQIYPTGVCIYFYLGFHAGGVADPRAAYEALEHHARSEILAAGGSLSHHHGIGKIRAEFLPRIYSPEALEVTRAVKKAMDPDNIFGAQNHGTNANG